MYPPVMRTGTLVTTATTADQVILTYTVTAGKTFLLEYVSINVRKTSPDHTDFAFGPVSLESPAGTKLLTWEPTSPSDGYRQVTFGEPLTFATGTVIRVVCTPGATTSYTWRANVGGYER